MSIFNYLFDNEWSQRADIEDLKAQAARLSDRSTRNLRYENRIKELETDIGELALLSKALMRILLEKGICTGRELEDLIKTIDMEDGVEDGKVTKVPGKQNAQCPQCGRPVHGNRKACLYCGYVFSKSN